MEVSEEIMHLVAGCARGDARSQRKLFKTFYGCAMGVCMRYADNPDEASDMLSEGFMKVFANIGKYQNSGSFEAWLKRVVANAALDYRRKFMKKVEFVDIDDVVEDVSDSSVNDALSAISSKEILKMIQSLPETSRVVFNMFVFEGYSHSEIAEALGITEGTSAWHVNNARQRLKKAILNN